MLAPPATVNIFNAGVAEPVSHVNDVGIVAPPSKFIDPAPLVIAIVPPALAKVAATGASPVEPIINSLKHKEPPPPMPFTVRGPYCWVRHPLYFFSLLMIWFSPVLTFDRLMFNILWTGWIIVGTILEERDLTVAFGDEYKEYQQKVPMLIPRSIGPVQTPL